MTDRSVPFDPNTPCDNCGAMGAFDFMGDYLCMKCGLGKQDMPWEELLSQILIHLERIENLMKRPQASPEVRWIPITESVPPERVEVLLRGWPYVHPHLSVVVGYREGNEYKRVAMKDKWICNPVYWMHILPLPEKW